MEPLTNMPLWAQILSMGSFMFASGILMTRLPLAPILMLSFFYLYGAFGNLTLMPSFTLRHPWWWTFSHLIVFVALLLIFILFVVLTAGTVDGGIGLGFFGIFLVFITACIAIGVLLVSVFPAFFKWVQLLKEIHLFPWSNTLWIILFISGIGVGILSIFSPTFLSCHGILSFLDLLSESISPFLVSTVIALIICVCSLSSIALGAKAFKGIFVCTVSILGSLLLLYNVLAHTIKQYHNYKRQQFSDVAKKENLGKTK